MNLLNNTQYIFESPLSWEIVTRIETKGQGFNQEKKDKVICKLFSLHHARHSNNFQIKMGENVCYV